jgi:hypothetical protein
LTGEYRVRHPSRLRRYDRQSPEMPLIASVASLAFSRVRSSERNKRPLNEELIDIDIFEIFREKLDYSPLLSNKKYFFRRCARTLKNNRR